MTSAVGFIAIRSHSRCVMTIVWELSAQLAMYTSTQIETSRSQNSKQCSVSGSQSTTPISLPLQQRRDNSAVSLANGAKVRRNGEGDSHDDAEGDEAENCAQHGYSLGFGEGRKRTAACTHS